MREIVEGSDELRANPAVAAHLAHVAYASRQTADGRVAPRYQITLASGMSEETPKRVRLGYFDYRMVDLSAIDPIPTR